MINLLIFTFGWCLQWLFIFCFDASNSLFMLIKR